MYRHIIIPTDGSETGTRAVEQGLDLARALGAELTILTVLQPFQVLALTPEVVAESTGEHERHLEEHRRTDDWLEQRVRTSGVTCSHIVAEHNHLSEAVRQAAEARGCDLIVMPAHERYTLLGRAVDSETARLLARSRLPVLVLH
jgi:nucleotide-binding universal stress UspA family protein